MNKIYIPGPGDRLGQYTGHPHDPRNPDDDDDATVYLINDVREWLDIAQIAAGNGDLIKARGALAEGKITLDELVQVAQ